MAVARPYGCRPPTSSRDHRWSAVLENAVDGCESEPSAEVDLGRVATRVVRRAEDVGGSVDEPHLFGPLSARQGLAEGNQRGDLPGRRAQIRDSRIANSAQEPSRTMVF